MNKYSLIQNGSFNFLFPLIKNGQSEYSIVIPKDCGQCLSYAAEELQAFIKKSTGVILPILISDNEKKLEKFISLWDTYEYKQLESIFDMTKLNGDGFIIKSKESNIFINAFCERGVLYGVYEFLERFFGIHFIAKDTTILPKKKNVYIPSLNIVEVPDFAMRGYLESSMYVGYEDIDFAQRMRAQHSFLFPEEKHGGRTKLWGRNNTHNFHYYVSPEIYNNPDNAELYHPEFFHHGDGTYGAEANTTVCLTNGLTEDGAVDTSRNISVAKVFIEELKKDIIANPDIEYFNLEQEDGPFCCQCSSCLAAEKKYKRSGMLIRMCNAIIKELNIWAKKQLGREIYLVTFAYEYTSKPPIKEENGIIMPIDDTVVASDRLIMRLALFNSYAYSYFDSRQRKDTREYLQQWKVVGKRFFGWIYESFFDRHFLFSPSFQNIKETVVGFKNYGVEYLMINGSYNTEGLWQDKLRAYMFNNLLWDSSQDEGILYERFLSAYFGKVGASYVKQVVAKYYQFYYDKLSKEDFVLGIYACKDKDFYSLELLLSTLNIVKEGREALKTLKISTKQKGKYDRHLAEVALASIFPLVEHYKHYFPDKSHEEYISFAKYFVEQCNYIGADRYAETRTIEFFVNRDYQFDY